MNRHTSETYQGDDLPLLDAPQEEKLDEMKDLASTKRLEAAEWIDSFFDDSRLTLEENLIFPYRNSYKKHSSVRLKNATKFTG